MNHPLPPWCLHWSSDGELTLGDRQDLLQRLAVHEQGFAGLLLSRSLPLQHRIQQNDRADVRSPSAF